MRTRTKTHCAHNVVAVFADEERARSAVDALRGTGIDAEQLSVVGRRAEGESVEEGAKVTNQMLMGGAKGSAVGGLAGLTAGALVLAVPGVGAVLGAGVLAGAVGGAAAGATAGALWGGFSRMWDMTYRDLVQEGRVLVAVHTDDEAEAAHATRLMHDAGCDRLDHLDARGEVRQRA
jgi:hypothetical protein